MWNATFRKFKSSYKHGFYTFKHKQTRNKYNIFMSWIIRDKQPQTFVLKFKLNISSSLLPSENKSLVGKFKKKILSSHWIIYLFLIELMRNMIGENSSKFNSVELINVFHCLQDILKRSITKWRTFYFLCMVLFMSTMCGKEDYGFSLSIIIILNLISLYR